MSKTYPELKGRPTRPQHKPKVRLAVVAEILVPILVAEVTVDGPPGEDPA